jgi:hypothetical protein
MATYVENFIPACETSNPVATSGVVGLGHINSGEGIDQYYQIFLSTAYQNKIYQIAIKHTMLP